MVQEYIDPIMQEIEVKSANNKRLLVYGVVNDTMAAKFSYFTDKIIANDKIHKSKDRDVRVMINSYGGSVMAGNSIIHSINKLKKQGFRVVGEVESCCYSMAYDVLVNCDYRVGSKTSTYLLHQTAYGISGELQEQMREAQFQKKLWEKSVDYYVKNTKLSRERINEIYDRKENYFFDEIEALENGSIHEIV